MRVTETSLPGVLLIEPKVFGDSRGFFFEGYHERRYQEAGIKGRFVQDNRSRSTRGVLRGLHYQLHHPQGKLVSVYAGEVYDVAVDIRLGSPTYGNYYGIHLKAEEHKQVYIPPGFAHGFCVLSDSADFIYKCTDYYNPDDEKGLQWNDPALGIQWPITDPELSGKDTENPTLEELRTIGDLPSYETLR